METKSAEEMPVNADENKNYPEYWIKWINNCKKNPNYQRHINQTREAYREFLKSEENDDQYRTQDRADIPRVYPAYYSAVNNLEPAFYSRTPELVTDTRFDIQDPVAVTMSLITERLGVYLMENSHFDDVMSMSVSDFIHGAKATNQIVYYANVDETGMADPLSQKICMAPACYDEILHSPNAKISSDITEMAYYFCYSKEEAESKGFDMEALKSYSWKSSPNQSVDQLAKRGRPVSTGEKYIDGYEIYCKDNKTVYWVSEGLPGRFLKPPAIDPYGFRNFFPSPPFIIQGKPPKNMFPTPAWIQLRPVALQLHQMYQRIFGLIDAVRRRAIVDGNEEVVALLNAGDQEFISATSLKSIVEKGGLQNMIWYLPVQELVNAINELNQQEQIFIANFDKWAGVPDIVQGLSDPIETLGAQEIKAGASHDRFKNAKKKVQQLARDSIEMMIDLAYKVFDDNKIAEIVGYQYMQPKDQQQFPQALELLRNDEARLVRIGIDTDSMTFVDKGLQTQRLNAAVTTVTQGLKQAAEMLQTSPDFALVGLQAVLLSLNQSEVGKKFMAPATKAIQDLIAQAEAAKQQPPPPPPPDPAMIRIEADKEMFYTKMNAELPMKQQQMELDHQYRMAQIGAADQKNINDANLKAQEIQAKILDIQTTSANAQQKIAVDGQYWLEENQIEARRNEIMNEANQSKNMIEMTKVELNKTIEENKIMLQQTIEDSKATMEALRLQLEKQRDDAVAYEKLVEEQRLKMEDQRRKDEQLFEVLKHITSTQEKTKDAVLQSRNISAQPPQSQPINVSVVMPKPTAKIGTITTGANGNPIVKIEPVEMEENESESDD